MITEQQTNGLMYPALQKFYSSLKSIINVKPDASFFDNISNIDNFFSEFRSITFVMQKSFDTPSLKRLYEEQRNIFLINNEMKWFDKERVKTIHKQPFQLIKRIQIIIYQFAVELPVFIGDYDINSDIPIVELINEFKTKILEIAPAPEYFGTFYYDLFENGSTISVIPTIKNGITTMNKFLTNIYSEIGAKDALSDKLFQKIRDQILRLHFSNCFFEHDFTYHISTSYFEFSKNETQLAFGINDEFAKPLSDVRKSFNEHFLNRKNGKVESEDEQFEFFVKMHVIVRNLIPHIMPVFMIVYSDNTYNIICFDTDCKATIYRNMAKIAERISHEDIVAVFFMSEVVVSAADKLFTTNYHERVNSAKKEFLMFEGIDNKLLYHSVLFDNDLLACETAYLGQIKNITHENNFYWGSIELAFQEKQAQNENG
jgi:hypothetical protein